MAESHFRDDRLMALFLAVVAEDENERERLLRYSIDPRSFAETERECLKRRVATAPAYGAELSALRTRRDRTRG
jgi:hypothetical protein